MKTYRFFYHYRKQTGGMTVHFRGVCHPCNNVFCKVTTETKWNKTQPRLVIQGKSKGLTFVGEGDDLTIIIN
jgi:hypothetical protein